MVMMLLLLLLLLVSVLIIKQRTKVLDYSIAIFCLNVKYANPTVKTQILLPSQCHHLFSI